MFDKVKLALLGAAQYIGRSCQALLLNDGFEKILISIDSGVNPSVSYIPENRHLLFPDMAGLDQMLAGVKRVFIFITHAHRDHCGGVPPMVMHILARHPKVEVNVITTKETWAFSQHAWRGDMQIMGSGNKNIPIPEWSGWKNGQRPFFTTEDIAKVAARCTLVETEKEYTVAENVTLIPKDAEHIFGAASLDIRAFGERIFATGDISFSGNHPFAPPPVIVPRPRPLILISEAVNAGNDREPEEEVFARWAYEILRVVRNKGGIALLPVFQLDRGQRIIQLLIRHGVPRELFYLDGGAKHVTRMYEKHLPKGALDPVRFIKDDDHREYLAALRTPCIVVASGGWVYGASARWAKRILPYDRNAMFLNGYIDSCTPADRIICATREKELADRVVEIDDERVPIHAEVHHIRISGHGDGGELEHMWEEIDPVNLVLNHAEKHQIDRYLASPRGKAVSGNVLFPPTRDNNGNLVVLEF